MDITVVIPVRNRAGIVERTLRSIEAQTYRPLKVILVDNGSTDDTRQVLEKWANAARREDFCVTVIGEPEAGAARARNAGLKAVDTEWTLFFDSDDEMLPTHIERAAQCLRKNPKADIIGWDIMLMLPDGRKKRCPFFSSDMLYNNVLHGGFATHRYAARTEIFRRAGCWNDSLGVWDDIELGTRLLTMKPQPVIFKVNGSPTVLIHFTADSLTGTMWSDKADAMCRVIDIIEERLPRQMRWIADLKRAQISRVSRKEGRKDIAARVLALISAPWYQRPIIRLGAYLPSDLLRPWL